MEIFGIKIGKKSAQEKIGITPDDASWVEEDMAILLKAIGYPSPDQLAYTSRLFPKSVYQKSFTASFFIEELLNLLGASHLHIEQVVYEDYSGMNIIPYAQLSEYVEAYVEELEEGRSYRIYISKRVTTNEFRLRAVICEEIVRIQFGIFERGDSQSAEEVNAFAARIYMIYLGLGCFINDAQNLVSLEYQAGIQSRRTYGPLLPKEVFAYALGLFAYLANDKEANWIKMFKTEIQLEFEKVMVYLSKFWPEELSLNKSNQKNILYFELDKAWDLYTEEKYSQAIELQSAQVPQIKDPICLARVLNNLGYFRLADGDIEGSILDFHEAISHDSTFPFAHDNLGFAYLLKGELEKANSFLETAMSLNGNDPAYSCRNKAHYYQLLGDMDQSLDYYKRAFAINTPVDYLYHLYGKFLIAYGEQALGEKYVKKETRKVNFEIK